MNSGLAVVLGALIALTGSALIPWLRESLSQRRMRAEAKRLRRDKALVEMVAKNDAFVMVWAGDDGAARSVAMEDRSRAAMRLLLSLDDAADRGVFASLLNKSLPLIDASPESAEEAGVKMAALQDVLVRWSADEIPSGQLLREFERRVAINNGKADGQSPD